MREAYLVSLVRHHGPGARLATLDEALARLHPDVVRLIGAPAGGPIRGFGW